MAKRTASFVMKNNMAPPDPILRQSNVVYKFTCPLPHRQAAEYIGMTQTTLSRRLTYHGQEGGIYDHFKSLHNLKPTREQLTNNTCIIAKETDSHKLGIKEALYILSLNPSMNKQQDNFANVLKLHKARNASIKPSKFVIDETPHNENIPIPDMKEILLKFGVDPSQFREVQLKDYHWNEFDDTLSVLELPSPPISQRLRKRAHNINYVEN